MASERTLQAGTWLRFGCGHVRLVHDTERPWSQRCGCGSPNDDVTLVVPR